MSTPTPAAERFDPALNMARQALYRFAALTLLDPRAGAWERLRQLVGNPLLTEAAALVRSLPEAQGDLGPGELPLERLDPRQALDRLPDSPDALNACYEGAFGLLVSNACPSCETEYIAGKLDFQRSNTLADVSGYYRAFGLAVSDLRLERPDHITLELEFLAVLIGLERRAAEERGPDAQERLEVCRRAQRRFLHEHLCWWAPAFAKLLQREAAGSFYEEAGAFLAALVAAERSLLHVPAPVRPAAPSSIEPAEACANCELSM